MQMTPPWEYRVGVGPFDGENTMNDVTKCDKSGVDWTLKRL